VILYLDGTPQSALYASGVYTYATNTLSVGNHTWYFNADKESYQPAVTAPQSYIIQPPILTNLTQSVTPASGTATAPATPTFICSYSSSGNPITGATVNVTVDSNIYAATYNSSTNDYRYSGIALTAGNHTWYCRASKADYQSQIGSLQSYQVLVPTPPIPVVALKGGPDGYLYIPNASKIDPTGHTTISLLKIDLWCNMSDTDCQTIGSPPRQICGCNRTWGDQTGGANPYYNKTNAPAFWRGAEWPDGKIRIDDTLLISTTFGANEGDTAPPQSKNWSYMADCIPDRMVRIDDVLRASSSFGADGAYSSNTTNIRVKFNNNPNFFTPDANGYVQIPSGALNFTVYNGTKPVLALATFYNTSAGLAAAKAKQAGIATPAVQMPIGDTWTMAVVILAIIGLGIGYFLAREVMFSTATRKAKKK
jgi:uncharacterized membrane protein